MSKHTGTCKWFNNEKGFGFLVNEDGEDVSIYYRSIMTDEAYKTLSEGQSVEYTQVNSEKGWQAAEAQLL